ncbi:MAG TPA: hypothetical protein VJ728_03560, partial [Candidatus Binataceae bacterium]|nr:hypothetical protein [Candidatus Binataceae bacterium]
WHVDLRPSDVNNLPHGACNHGLLNAADQCDATDGCSYPQDLYYDSLVRLHTLSWPPPPGSWYLDYAGEHGPPNRLYVADDPKGHLVELGVTPAAIRSAAQNVTVDNLAITKFAAPNQDGAVEIRGSNWLVRHLLVYRNHGGGIEIVPPRPVLPNGNVVDGNDLAENGEEGYGEGRSFNDVFSNNVSEFNNIDGVCYGFEGGCGKVVGWGTQLTGNICRWNNGTGLWTDADARRDTYDGNSSYGNIGEGLRYEESHSGRIIKNVIGPDARPDNVQCVAAHVPKLLDGIDACTGFQTGTASYHCYDVEIAIVNSDDTLVGGEHSGNKVTTYCGGIVINENRPRASVNDKVLFNDVTFHRTRANSDPLGGTSAGGILGFGMFTAGSGNVFDYNRYLVDEPPSKAARHWRWMSGSSLSRLDWSAWRALGMDTHGWLGTGNFPKTSEPTHSHPKHDKHE